MSFKMMPLFFEELGNTLTMTFVSSFLAYIIGIPLGILLVVWAGRDPSHAQGAGGAWYDH